MPNTNISTPNFIPYQLNDKEEYMSNPQLQHFKDFLLKWKQNLIAEMERTVHHMQDDVSTFPDPTDRASQETEYSIELRTRDRERKLIKKIDQTLILIDNKEYGYCNNCGIEIGLRRLEARPTATMCIDCKTQDELREKYK